MFPPDGLTPAVRPESRFAVSACQAWGVPKVGSLSGMGGVHSRRKDDRPAWATAGRGRMGTLLPTARTHPMTDPDPAAARRTAVPRRPGGRALGHVPRIPAPPAVRRRRLPRPRDVGAAGVRPARRRCGARRALDYGCGHGMAAVVLARAGATVSAFDLSPGYVAEAERAGRGERGARAASPSPMRNTCRTRTPVVRRRLGQRHPAPPRFAPGRGGVEAGAEARRGGGVLRAVGRQPAARIRPPPAAVPRQAPHRRRTAAAVPPTSPRCGDTSRT